MVQNLVAVAGSSGAADVSLEVVDLEEEAVLVGMEVLAVVADVRTAVGEEKAEKAVEMAGAT